VSLGDGICVILSVASQFVSYKLGAVPFVCSELLVVVIEFHLALAPVLSSTFALWSGESFKLADSSAITSTCAMLLETSSIFVTSLGGGKHFWSLGP